MDNSYHDCTGLVSWLTPEPCAVLIYTSCLLLYCKSDSLSGLLYFSPRTWPQGICFARHFPSFLVELKDYLFVEVFDLKYWPPAPKYHFLFSSFLQFTTICGYSISLLHSWLLTLHLFWNTGS